MIPTGGTQAISCAFSYSAASYTDADPDPTPTVTGTSGGTFTSTAGIVINADTGEIDLSASAVNTYVVTYTVGAKACTQSVEITASFSNTKSLAFDGVDDSVNIGLLSALNGSQYFSISMWVNPSALTAATDFMIFSIYTSANDRIFLEFFGNKLVVNISNGGSKHMLFPMTFSTGQWYNIIAIYDGTQVGADRLKCYVDAVAQTNTQVSFNVNLATFTSDYHIGSYPDGSWGFNGNIDEVALFDSALTSGNVTSIFNGGTPNDLTSLNPLAWYRMGDKVTSWPTIPDQAGSNDGTATNMDISDIETDVPT